MQNKLEKIIQLVYKKWKTDKGFSPGSRHPDEADMACFLEGRLSRQENERLKLHFIYCARCAESLALQVKLGNMSQEETVPSGLIDAAKALVEGQAGTSLLEIFLKLKEKALEILYTSGEVFVGREFVPAPLLRGRRQKDFKDEVAIRKDFQEIRVEVRVVNKRQGVFNLAVCAKNKKTRRVIKDLRVSLLEGDRELESYLSDKGEVTFEHISLGKYLVEICDIDNKLASVLLDIKK